MEPCLCCGRSGPPEPHFRGLLRCPDCGFVWADVRLAPEEVRALYDRNYFHDGEYRDYVAERPAIERTFHRFLAILRRHCPTGALFDIGCAYGFFLNLARQWYQPVAGVDVSAEAVDYAKTTFGLEVYGEEFLDLPIAPGAYDVFTCWFTIEHLTQPLAYLERVRDLLPTAGHLALLTGDIEAINARLAGPRWRQIHPPTHLSYFSRRSLSRLLDRLGFDIVHFSYAGVYRTVGLVLHALLARRCRRLYEWLAPRAICRLVFYANSYDNMLVIARKRGAHP